MPIPHKHFYMIRHGETIHNAAHILAGSTDSPLSELGHEQAGIARDIVSTLPVKPKAIMHSNLSRARDTAHTINQALNVPIHEDPDIAEHFCGDWEGEPYSACEGILTGWNTPPNGEDFDAFCTRIRRAKTQALTAHESPILIVSHGGVFRGFGRLYNVNAEGVFKNCHLYEFKPAPENRRFPWDVFSYHMDDCGVVKTPNTVYHDCDDIQDPWRYDAAIAS